MASAISDATGQPVDPGALTSGNSQAVSNAINTGTGSESQFNCMQLLVRFQDAC